MCCEGTYPLPKAIFLPSFWTLFPFSRDVSTGPVQHPVSSLVSARRCLHVLPHLAFHLSPFFPSLFSPLLSLLPLACPSPSLLNPLMTSPVSLPHSLSSPMSSIPCTFSCVWTPLFLRLSVSEAFILKANQRQSVVRRWRSGEITGNKRKPRLEKSIYFFLSLFFWLCQRNMLCRFFFSHRREDPFLFYHREKQFSKNGSMPYIAIVKCCIRRISTNFNA